MPSRSPRTLPTLLALTVAAGLLAGCGSDDEATVVEQAQDAGRAERIVGDEISVTADVEERVTPNSFLLEDGTLVFGPDVPLVLPGDEVTAAGVVVRLDIPEVEREYDLEIQDELFADFEGDLALLADDVDVAGIEEAFGEAITNEQFAAVAVGTRKEAVLTALKPAAPIASRVFDRYALRSPETVEAECVYFRQEGGVQGELFRFCFEDDVLVDKTVVIPEIEGRLPAEAGA